MLKPQKKFIYRSAQKVNLNKNKSEGEIILPVVETKKPLFIKKKRRKLRFFRIRKSYKFTSHPTLNPIATALEKKSYLQNFSQQITIKVKPNNVFCTLRNNKKTLYITSSGKCNLNASKKTLKYTTKIILQFFFHNIKKYIKTKNKKDKYFLIKLCTPKRSRVPIFKQLQEHFKKKELLFDVKGKKCFNGCRPSKQKRKKQKGLRIFK